MIVGGEWQRYRRCGEVTAERRDYRWTWKTDAGASLVAEPGDWAVAGDVGHERCVSADVFEATHEWIEQGRYRRIGTVLARPATAGEVVATLEGEIIAQPGDWIVEGTRGERWPVSAVRFSATYEGPLDP